MYLIVTRHGLEEHSTYRSSHKRKWALGLPSEAAITGDSLEPPEKQISQQHWHCPQTALWLSGTISLSTNSIDAQKCTIPPAWTQWPLSQALQCRLPPWDLRRWFASSAPVNALLCGWQGDWGRGGHRWCWSHCPVPQSISSAFHFLKLQ